MEGKTLFIAKKDLHRLIFDLEQKYEIYAPMKTKDDAVFSKYEFARVSPDSDLALNYPTTNIPPTKFFFPARENILEFNNGEEVEVKPPKKKVIFGIKHHDLKAINCLDQEFLKPIKDEVYFKNRLNSIIVGIDYFDPSDVTFDLYLMPVSTELYEVFVGSAEGEKIIKHEHFFKNGKPRTASIKHTSNSPIHHPKLSEILKNSKNDPIWDELAQICFGCGICTYVCPLCYCFETEDKVMIDGLNINVPAKCKGCRERRWDSCMLPDFAAISSHNFRPELRDRIYNWYHHKFVRTPHEHGFVGCVDCERCVIFCPAKINFHETLERLIKKYT